MSNFSPHLQYCGDTRIPTNIGIQCHLQIWDWGRKGHWVLPWHCPWCLSGTSPPPQADKVEKSPCIPYTNFSDLQRMHVCHLSLVIHSMFYKHSQHVTEGWRLGRVHRTQWTWLISQAWKWTKSFMGLNPMVPIQVYTLFNLACCSVISGIPGPFNVFLAIPSFHTHLYHSFTIFPSYCITGHCQI